MSVQLINQYYTEVDRIIQFGGSKKETSIRTAFQKLLEAYAQKRDLILIAELDYKTPQGKTVFPDGTLKDALRLTWGYWESKDSQDDLAKEIQKKFNAGYPDDNILFEDSQTAVLYQQGKEILRGAVRDALKLDGLLNAFVNYVRPEVRNFRAALEQFKQDIPQVLKALRELIQQQGTDNAQFKQAQKQFLEICKKTINTEITQADVNEMLIQHILTEEIFTSVFDDPLFHQENNISQELQKLERTFFTGAVRRNTLDSIKSYYLIIKAQAANIANHTEKQKFLKIIYENFYKAYNPKGADKLGIVYTPDEIVKFMLESTDYLLHQHFNKILASPNVEILDPATGTGTFVCDLIDYLPKDKLKHKYQHEIHCNEVAILPYYIANLNIEATYKQKMGTYEEFQNICFADTLENTEALQNRVDKGKQTSFDFAFSAENAERIKRQNKRKISVIIGNPPYNAKQENYNYQNANKAYQEIDKRIKDTYVKLGTAQNQIVVYDMYTRFYRWAMDRLHNEGIIAFITNRSFIDSRTFDGFRKVIQDEFDYCYIVDTQSDVRANPKIAGTTHNVFGIQTGVAIAFLIKTRNTTPSNSALKGEDKNTTTPNPSLIGGEFKDSLPLKGGQGRVHCKIYYASLPDDWRKEVKLNWLTDNPINKINFTYLSPDKKNNWINQTDNDFEDLIPLIDKNVKTGKLDEERAIFKLFSRGVASQRDEWVYDLNKDHLSTKIQYFTEVYQNTIKDKKNPDKMKIKWDRELEGYLNRGIQKEFVEKQVIRSLYRPYFRTWFYFDKHFNGMTYQWYNLYNEKNKFISINSLGMDKPFGAIANQGMIDVQAMPNGQCLSLYRYDEKGQQFDNITNWALKTFREYYKALSSSPALPKGEGVKTPPLGAGGLLEKEDIFHYVYAVLHHPVYRVKYEQNLKRDFPRIPLYADFWQWSAWGKQLLDWHIGYEEIEPYGLQVLTPSNSPLKGGELKNSPPFKEGQGEIKNIKPEKVMLKADKENHCIHLTDQCTLMGIPAIAWTYKLGNRSALEWVLDQYKESKPGDPTILEKFNTYRFLDYKDQVIDLLKRVCTVSVRTMELVEQMPK